MAMQRWVKVVARPYQANATTAVIITDVKRLGIFQEGLSKSKKLLLNVCQNEAVELPTKQKGLISETEFKTSLYSLCE
uniref:Uncharacterized protein n=1 Tax=Wuchereria bancrofti TaxID=6293 RepID=A0A1I8E8N3_WUCBA